MTDTAGFPDEQSVSRSVVTIRGREYEVYDLSEIVPLNDHNLRAGILDLVQGGNRYLGISDRDTVEDEVVIEMMQLPANIRDNPRFAAMAIVELARYLTVHNSLAVAQAALSEANTQCTAI